MGAGILPVAIHQGQLYFLFGQEHDTRDWSDFGGGQQGSETPLQNAVREACEELNGFLGCKSDLVRLIHQKTVLKVTVETYVTYVVHIPFDQNLPVYFNNHHKFIKTHLPKQIGTDGLFEKSTIRWFSIPELRRQRKIFRPFYRRVLDAVLQQVPTAHANANADAYTA
jgi:8-oxo-dGTP pyrophosphatase MutT (NUDIX family)